MFVICICQILLYRYLRVVENPRDEALLWFLLETPTLRPTHLIENNKVVVLVKEVFPETVVQELFLVEKTFQKAVLKTYFST